MFIEFLNDAEERADDVICLSGGSIYFCTVLNGFVCIEPGPEWGCDTVTVKCVAQATILV